MQKIIIQDFGPIRKAEIEIRPFTVLLGEQATGKSTVAQCVHLFLSLGEDFIRDLKNVQQDLSLSKTKEAVGNIVRSKFYAYYGSTKYLDEFDVKFFFDVNQDKYIHIRPLDGINTVTFSDGFELNHFCQEVIFSAEQANGSFQKRDLLLTDLVNNFFGIMPNVDTSPPKYFPAGRNITTSYSWVFRDYFMQNFRQPHRLNARNVAKSAQMELISDFILYSSEMKDRLMSFGGNFKKLLEENLVPTAFIRDFMTRATNILKGTFIISNGDELIKIRSGKHIPLHFASSGQQESIRIIQDLSLSISFFDETRRTIEEPEAHLFPSAQNALTDLLVMTYNRTGSHFFLTTHSPYFLSSFNNLLYAAKAAGDNLPPEATPDPTRVRRVEALGYAPYLRLKAQDFAAYQLKDGTAESIYDAEKAITNIDELDEVSLEIAQKFAELVDIVKENEAYENA